MAINVNDPARDSQSWMPTNLMTMTIARPHHGTPPKPIWTANHRLSRESEAQLEFQVDWTASFMRPRPL